MLLHVLKEGFAVMIMVRLLEREIVLDYSGGLSAITGVFVRGKPFASKSEKDMKC